MPLQTKRVCFSSSLLLEQQDFYEQLIYELFCVGLKGAVDTAKDHKLVLVDDALHTKATLCN